MRQPRGHNFYFIYTPKECQTQRNLPSDREGRHEQERKILWQIREKFRVQWRPASIRLSTFDMEIHLLWLLFMIRSLNQNYLNDCDINDNESSYINGLFEGRWIHLTAHRSSEKTSKAMQFVINESGKRQ